MMLSKHHHDVKPGPARSLTVGLNVLALTSILPTRGSVTKIVADFLPELGGRKSATTFGTDPRPLRSNSDSDHRAEQAQ